MEKGISKVVRLDAETIKFLYDEQSYRKFDDVVLVTHPGVFHADDVCCAALLEYALALPGWQPSAKIHVIRAAETGEHSYESMAREVSGAVGKFIALIVFDIGGGDFDHHQGKELRDNGSSVPYAAFGKIWRSIGGDLVNDEAAAVFDERIVQPVDAGDNGLAMNPLSGLVSAFNPNWNDEQSTLKRNVAFENATTAVKTLFAEWFRRVYSSEEAAEFIRKMYYERKDAGGDTRILPMNTFAPSGKLFVDEFPEVVFTLYPSARGGYNISAVPATPGGFDNKVKLPERWLTTPPDGCTFVHKDKFVASFEEPWQALNAAEEYLRELDRRISDGHVFTNGVDGIWFSDEYRRN